MKEFGWRADLIRCAKGSESVALYGTDLLLDQLPAMVSLYGNDGQGVILGRGYSHDHVCVDPNPRSVVSKKHATIYYNNEGFLIQDHGSTNGTFVNWKKVARSPLQDGDSVVFGGGANIELGQYMTNAQRQHSQLLEWKFRVVHPAAHPILQMDAALAEKPQNNSQQTSSTSSTTDTNTPEPNALTPQSTSSARQRSKRFVGPPPPPPPKPSPKLAVDSPIQHSPGPPPSTQRETIGAVVLAPEPLEVSQEPVTTADSSEAHHEDHVAVETQGEVWLINSDAEEEDQQCIAEGPNNTAEDENTIPTSDGLKRWSPAEATALLEDFRAEPLPLPGMFKGFDTMEASLHLVCDDSSESDSPPRAKRPRRLVFDELPIEGSRVALVALQDICVEDFPEPGWQCRDIPRPSIAGKATQGPPLMEEGQPLQRRSPQGVQVDGFSFDAEETPPVEEAQEEDRRHSLSQAPLLPLPEKPLPFAGMPAQRLTSVRIGIATRKPWRTMEFTESQWKIMVEDPHFGRHGTFRLIINVKDIVWMKDHVMKTPFFIVLSTSRPLPGMELSIYDPNAKELRRRTIMLELATRAEGKALRRSLGDNYMAWLTPDKCDIVPEKEVYTYYR
eukprot:GGOE01002595.1.p1 GENE.GGOE01002595.1~~GGOE01002595.1.p1  ORF type:complete len:632 (-),score=97.32 GGOE01002595.1:288-2132(-)